MKKLIVTIIVPVIVVISAALLFGFMYGTVTAPTKSESAIGGSGDRMMDIDTYVRLNIAALSLEPAVLGGTLHVTEIESDNGHGTVHYEDGHNAFVADFAYTTSETSGHTISSFTVRPQ